MARSSTPAERTTSSAHATAGRKARPSRAETGSAASAERAAGSSRADPDARAPRADALFIASVGKAFTVLEALNSAARALSLTELARTTGLSRSAVQRLTHTLVSLGYLRQHAPTRAYALSGRLLEFGHTVLATHRLRERAIPHLEALNRATGETVNLMEMEGAEIVYVARFPSVHAVSVDLHVGSRLPAFCTAAGRAMLAQLDTEDAAARLRAAPRRPMTARTVTDVAQILRLLAEARRSGYALNDQEAFVGDISIAAPLAARAGAVVGAINIAVPTPRWKIEDVRRKLAPKVVATARQIEGDLAGL
jgi:DNA-binding IclR family transcriptional regulator